LLFGAEACRHLKLKEFIIVVRRCLIHAQALLTVQDLG